MNHKVLNVSELHRYAKELFDRSVVGSGDSSADMIISNLDEGIQILKNTWKGKDAGVQIQNVVSVYNGMVALRNELSILAASTTKIAADYREIQNMNGVRGESLTTVSADSKTTMDDYSDTRDTVDITAEANNGRMKIEAAKNGLERFEVEVRNSLTEIMNNWQAGSGRDKAVELFDGFQSQVGKYKTVLGEVSQSITTAIQNYSL